MRDLLKNPFTPEERRALKIEVDLVKRERVKKTRRVDSALARHARTSTVNRSTASVKARMAPEEVEAAFRAYCDGMLPEEIATQLWRKHGYSSHGHCVRSLLQRFESLGLTRAV